MGCQSWSMWTISAMSSSPPSIDTFPSPRKANFRVAGRLGLVHGYVCGPIIPSTHGNYGGCRYFLLLVDDCTRCMWVVFLAGKWDAAASIQRVQAAAEAECGRPLHVFRTDNGGEFTSLEFAHHCEEQSVQASSRLPTPHSRME